MAAENPTLEQFVSVCQAHLDNNETEWREEVELRSESSRRVLMCACTALPGSIRDPGGVVLVFDDLTELLQAQRDAAWGEVARRLAHEIKNPLTPIQLSAERIRRRYLGQMGDLPTQLLDRATHTIVQQVEAMRDMVNAFSEYARAPQMNVRSVDLNKLITQVADLYPAQDHQPALVLDLDENLPDVEVDAVRIRQVLHNLIRNALEAMEGQQQAEVELSSRLTSSDGRSMVAITVADNGPGFPESDREQVFEPYVTTKSKGTGLGLAIVKKLVEEHSGEVTVESQPGRGARVVILLPVKKPSKKDKQPPQLGADKRRESA